MPIGRLKKGPDRFHFYRNPSFQSGAFEMTDHNAEFFLGRCESDFLRVRPTERACPDTDDYWDGNWLNTNVELAAGAFRGQYEACLRVDELIRFRDQFARVYHVLNGLAEFDTMEHWLSIRIKGDGLGHFNADCEARDEPGFGNTLSFSLYFDQTEIPKTLRGLDLAIEQFPLIGNRNA